MKNYFHPLMDNNITDKDIKNVISFLKKNKKKIFTQSNQVNKFEKEWSKWLGCKYSVLEFWFISKFIVDVMFKDSSKKFEVIVPTLTWISDIASVIKNNIKPVFADINLKNLCMMKMKFIKSNKKYKQFFNSC